MKYFLFYTDRELGLEHLALATDNASHLSTNVDNYLYDTNVARITIEIRSNDED